MFGALNRFISVLDRGPEESQNEGTQGAFGFQVLRNKNEELPLEPWFDFIIGINGRTLDNGDPHLFATEVRNCAGNSISLGVWSAKGQRIREIYVQVPGDTASLGLSLQWMPLASTEDVWHILDVAPNSPADVAGLLPFADYVIGSPEGLMRGEAGLGDLVEEHIDTPLILYVYNHEYNLTRPVTITPSRSWGGPGLLGCTLGFGALHRIPAPLDEPVQQPGETMFDYSGSGEKTGFPPTHDPTAGLEGNGFTPVTPADENPPPVEAGAADFLVPANLETTSSPTGSAMGAPPKGPPKGPTGRKGRAHHHHAAGTDDMDDYFKEGEEKSIKENYGASPAPGSAVPPPPPPKMGGKAGTPRAETRSPAPVEAGDSDA